MFQNGNSAFLFYEVWGNDPSSETCTQYTDASGNTYTICAYTRFLHDYGWGEISSTDILFDSSGAQLTTTTGAGFSATRCTTNTAGPTPVTACAAAGPVGFDLDWTGDVAGIVCNSAAAPTCVPAVPAVPAPVLSSQYTAGLTQYSIGAFTFTSQSAIKANSAYVYGTALGRDVRFAPGRLGTTKGKHVATD